MSFPPKKTRRSHAKTETRRHTGHALAGFTLLLMLLGLASGSWADTQVSGTITTDTTWNLAGSPYIVTGALRVQGTDGADGVTTLTIQPGVEVRFNAQRSLSIGNSSGSPG
ncbi:MAG: hypothetical protein JXB25_07440, partial [Deltaproteobacteria bacterium]|nr:hypothetical protein [Deltaproteobacteria bacterium]